MIMCGEAMSATIHSYMYFISYFNKTEPVFCLKIVKVYYKLITPFLSPYAQAVS